MNIIIIVVQTVGVASELRNPVYRAVAIQAVDFDQLLQMMASVKWDVRDIMSQHSGYVDVVLRVSSAPISCLL